MAQLAKAPATKLSDLSSIPMTHVVERENGPFQVFLCASNLKTHRKIKHNF